MICSPSSYFPLRIFSDEVALYNLMRETLVYLTNLSGHNTQVVMMSLLKTFTDDAKVPNQRNWNPTVLSRLCWAIGMYTEFMYSRYLLPLRARLDSLLYVYGLSVL